MKPVLLVGGVVATGMVLDGVGWWRLGSGLLGLGFCLAAVLRLVLPAAQVGELAVRSRWVDATVLLALGFGLVALANTIPGGH